MTYQTTVQNDVEAVKNTLGAIDWDAIENDAKAQREAQIDSAVEAALNETMQETSLSEEEQEILREYHRCYDGTIRKTIKIPS